MEVQKLMLMLLPLNLSLMAVEYVWYRRRGKTYPWGESAASFAVQTLQRFLKPLLGMGIILKASELAYAHRFMTIQLDQPAALLGLFFGFEFLYYWSHRAGHQIRWAWAAHAVHHSPNQLALPSAGRLGFLDAFAGTFVLFLPLMLVGYSPQAVGSMFAVNLAYQFWLHTDMIPKLGWFELVFNTPSHHRVHHASNVRYLDANYGGILIIYDRIFGSFIEEDAAEPCVYGLTKPLKSYNPLRIAFFGWFDLARDAVRHCRSPRVMVRYLFGPPGWSHDGSSLTTAMLREGARTPASAPERSAG